MTVVDSHVHLLPGRLGEKVRAFFDAGVSSTFTLAYPNNHPVVIDTLAREGVDAIWTLPYAHKPGVAEGLNSASAETVAASAGVPRTVEESCSTEEFSARAEPPARSTPAMESDVASPDFM